jgi:hypothetical protein
VSFDYAQDKFKEKWRLAYHNVSEKLRTNLTITCKYGSIIQLAGNGFSGVNGL